MTESIKANIGYDAVVRFFNFQPEISNLGALNIEKILFEVSSLDRLCNMRFEFN